MLLDFDSVHLGGPRLGADSNLRRSTVKASRLFSDKCQAIEVRLRRL
jgi:hypothetical protein